MALTRAKSTHGQRMITAIDKHRPIKLQKLVSHGDCTLGDFKVTLCYLAEHDFSAWHEEATRMICERMLVWRRELIETFASWPNTQLWRTPDAAWKYKIQVFPQFGPLHLAARCGNVAMLQLLVEKYSSIFDINQMDDYFRTPLHLAVGRSSRSHDTSTTMCRFLLEHGANPNEFDVDIYEMDRKNWRNALSVAVEMGNTEVVRMLLAAGAHLKPQVMPPGPAPRTLVEDEDYFHVDNQDMELADCAVSEGNIEILIMLLEHGGRVGYLGDSIFDSGLCFLLCLRDHPAVKSRETKLAICRILVDHAKKNAETVEYLQAVFEHIVVGYIRFEDDEEEDNEEDDSHLIPLVCEILVEAGIAGCRPVLHRAVQNRFLAIWDVLVNLGVDPSLPDEPGIDDKESHYGSASPFFVTAAHQEDTTLFEFFIDHWNERFASTGGRDNNGDAPMDHLCRDPRVSIQAVTLLVTKYEANISVAAGNGWFPLQSAIMSDAKLEVIFYLLSHGPGVLAEQRFPIGPPVVYYHDRSIQADSEPRQPTVESLQNDIAALQAENDLLRQRLATNAAAATM